MHTATHMHACSQLSHRKADRHQFPYMYKSGLPQGTKLGSSILLCSSALFSSDNSKHYWHFHLSFFHIILCPFWFLPLIGVLFVLTIPETSCLFLSQRPALVLNLYLHWAFLLPPGHACATCDTGVFHVCPPGCVSRLLQGQGRSG